MKEFYSDYVELMKVTGKFYKKHWKGVLVVNVVVLGAEIAYFARKDMKLRTNLSCKNKDEEGLE